MLHERKDPAARGQRAGGADFQTDAGGVGVEYSAGAAEGEPKPARLFPTGCGQSDTHATTLTDGRPNPSRSAGEPYDGVSGREIVALMSDPPSVPKENARWFIPSDHLASDARSHEAQRERGRFWWLPLDVDTGNLAAADVLEAIREATGGARCFVYSSRSATPDNRKWRALVPLKSPIPGADYSATCEAFFDLLEEASQGVLIPDRALARPGQLVYLPNRGEHYERHRADGPLLDLTPNEAMTCAAHPIVQRRERRAAAEREAEAERKRRSDARRARAGDGPSPVDHFKARNDVADLLSRYGYAGRGNGRDWRSPYQTTKGSYATRCFGEYWVSVSGSDAAAELGAATQSGFRHGDAFDLYAHYEHGGDFKAAVRAYAAEAGLNGRARGDGDGDAAPGGGDNRDDGPHDLSHDALALEMERRDDWREDARHVSLWAAWLFWTGTHWRRDDRLEHMTRTRAFLRAKAEALIDWAERKAAKLEAQFDQKGAEKLRGWASGEARTLRHKSTVAAVETLARSNPALVAAADDFDRDRLLLGTPGGTVDLRTGRMRPARRGDMVTKLTAVAPASGSPERWLAFLSDIFDADAKMIAFLQRAAGYALTGETREHKLLFLYGTGRNGKSVFLNTLFHIWGSYARRAHATAFLNSNGEKHPTDIAGLQGARLVAGSELPKGRSWDESTIKDLTGGDVLTARFMRGDFFDFEPHLTLMIAGNNMPSFRGVDEAIRARVVLVPFTVTIPPERRDPHLAEKLKAEAGQILQWAIDGALEWQRRGLAVPASVAAASTEYLDDEDLLGQFLADETEPDPLNFVTTTDLHDRFRMWAERQGLNPWTLHTMRKEVKTRGYEEARRKYGRGFLGIRLRG